MHEEAETICHGVSEDKNGGSHSIPYFAMISADNQSPTEGGGKLAGQGKRGPFPSHRQLTQQPLRV